MTAAGLRRLRSWRRTVATDLDRARAAALATDVVADAAAVARAAEVIVLASWSRRPLLHARDLRPGHHLTTLGADEPGKAELSAGRVVVDDRDLAAAGGALGTAGLPASAAVTLGEILRGDRPARQNTRQPTVYAPVGLPWQDLAVTWLVYRAVVGDGRVPAVDLLS